MAMIARAPVVCTSGKNLYNPSAWD